MNESRANFLNQYAKIPESISEKLDALYSERYASVRHCLGLIIVNLLVLGSVAYSSNKNFYTKNKTRYFTYTNVLNAVEIAESAGYAIKLSKGYFRSGKEKGESSTLGAGPGLKEFEQISKLELEVESLPLLSIDDKPVFEGDDLNQIKSSYIEATVESHALIERLERVNEEAKILNRQYWNKIHIDTRHIDSSLVCVDRVGLTRIFNNGLMGRWYQKGDMSFQQLPSDERPKLLLNGEPVVEIDYSASHPHLLYAWENEQCPDDFYERIMEQSKCSRSVAKDIFLYAVNCDSLQQLTGTVNSKPVYVELTKSGATMKQVLEAIAEAHPTMQKYIYSASANKLMFDESEIMTEVLLSLMRMEIPALPVHDSVIVQQQHEEVARTAMRRAYQQRTGFEPAIK